MEPNGEYYRKVHPIKMNYLILLCILVALSSCTKTHQYNEIRTINLKKCYIKERKLSLTEIAEKIRYVRLESSDSALFGNADRIQVGKKFIAIFDNTTFKLLIFDIEGNYINKFGTKGKGPGELQHIAALKLVEMDTSVYMYDDYQKAIVKFNFISNSHTRFKTKNYFTDFEKIESGFILGINHGQAKHSKNCLVLKVNQNFENGKCLIPNDMDVGKSYGLSTSYLYYFKDSLTYWSFIGNEIIKFGPNFTPDYKIVFSNYNHLMPKDIRLMRGKTQDHYLKYDHFLNFTETSKFLFLNAVKHGATWNPILVDKHTLEGFSIEYDRAYSPGGIDDDIDHLIPFWPDGCTSNGNPYDIFDINEIVEYLLSRKRSLEEIPDCLTDLAKNGILQNPILRILN